MTADRLREFRRVNASCARCPQRRTAPPSGCAAGGADTLHYSSWRVPRRSCSYNALTHNEQRPSRTCSASTSYAKTGLSTCSNSYAEWGRILRAPLLRCPLTRRPRRLVSRRASQRKRRATPQLQQLAQRQNWRRRQPLLCLPPPRKHRAPTPGVKLLAGRCEQAPWNGARGSRSNTLARKRGTQTEGT